jgi:predicted transcriptional regulator
LPHYLSDDKTVANFVDDALLSEDTKKAATKLVIDFVDKNDVTIEPDANLLEATLLSASDSLGRLIVIDDDKKPLGILTRTEIKQVLAEYLDIENDLENICKENNC